MSDLKKNNSLSIGGWAKEVFFARRMNSVPGWIVMALVGIGIAFTAIQFGTKVPLIIVAGVMAILFVLICMRYSEFAYYNYIFSILVFTLPARLAGIGIPLGAAIEASGYLAAFAVMSKQYRARTSSAGFWKSPISVMTLLLFFYLMLEALNPEISRRLGWFVYFRRQISYLVFYYISFLMLDSIEKIRRFIKLWIILTVIIALWGIKQQWFGFSYYEMAWINSDPNIAVLLFQGGMFRKFSLMPDPASFGVLAASTSLFTLVLAIRSPNKRTQRILYFITVLELISSSYSGTRTCNVMLAGGLAAYIIFTLNERKTIIVLVSSILISGFLLFGPFQNNLVISRIKTTFAGSKDPSNIVRDINRRNIQPYIYARPLGGGINTCGEEGKQYYPEHRLAGYPPDSGYMKIMLEQGWIGLIINIAFYFVILQRGITGFFDSKKEEIKTLYIALTVCLFSLILGQYSQLAISQYPQYLFYVAALVIFYKLKEFDNKKPKHHEKISA